MASVANYPKWQEKRSSSAILQYVPRLSWAVHLFGMILFSLPYLLLGYFSHRLMFVSDIHAQTVTKVLLALEQGKLELIGFAYPPLPSLITTIYPDPITLMICSALAAGTLMWVLWNHLRETRLSLFSRSVLLLGLAIVPSGAFLVTQSFNECASLLLFLLSWRSFVQFTRKSNTQQGFFAGLILGLAFYFSVYALLYAIMYAVSAPFFYEWPDDLPVEERFPAALTGMVVISFPTVVGFLGWAYLNWLFTGDVWYFLNDPISPVYSYLQTDGLNRSGWSAAMEQTLFDLARSPIYLLIGLITLYHATYRLPVYLLPAVLITVVRAIGFTYPEAFALGSYLVLGLMAIPRNTSRSWGPILILAVVLHVLVGYLGIEATPEIRDWQATIQNGTTLERDEWEITIGQRLAEAPAGSILADDHSAYRMIMRAGTTMPFLLPYDAAWEIALNEPPKEILYILVSNSEAGFRDRLAERSLFGVPPGFVIEANWPGWTLYRRGTAPTLLTNASTES